MSRPTKDGKATLKDEYEAVTRMRGVLHEALDYPEMPSVMRPLFNVYNDLSGMSFQELKAYRDMTGTNVDLFDVDLMKDIEYTKSLISDGKTVKQVMGSFKWQL